MTKKIILAVVSLSLISITNALFISCINKNVLLEETDCTDKMICKISCSDFKKKFFEEQKPIPPTCKFKNVKEFTLEIPSSYYVVYYKSCYTQIYLEMINGMLSFENRTVRIKKGEKINHSFEDLFDGENTLKYKGSESNKKSSQSKNSKQSSSNSKPNNHSKSQNNSKSSHSNNKSSSSNNNSKQSSSNSKQSSSNSKQNNSNSKQSESKKSDPKQNQKKNSETQKTKNDKNSNGKNSKSSSKYQNKPTSKNKESSKHSKGNSSSKTSTKNSKPPKSQPGKSSKKGKSSNKNSSSNKNGKNSKNSKEKSSKGSKGKSSRKGSSNKNGKSSKNSKENSKGSKGKSSSKGSSNKNSKEKINPSIKDASKSLKDKMKEWMEKLKSSNGTKLPAIAPVSGFIRTPLIIPFKKKKKYSKDDFGERDYKLTKLHSNFVQLVLSFNHYCERMNINSLKKRKLLFLTTKSIMKKVKDLSSKFEGDANENFLIFRSVLVSTLDLFYDKGINKMCDCKDIVDFVNMQRVRYENDHERVEILNFKHYYTERFPHLSQKCFNSNNCKEQQLEESKNIINNEINDIVSKIKKLRELEETIKE